MLELHGHDVALYRRCPALFDFTRRGFLPRGQTIKPKMVYGSLWHALFVSKHLGEEPAVAFERVASEYNPRLRPLLAQMWEELPGDMEWYEREAPSLEISDVLWIESPGNSLRLQVSPTLALLFRPDLVCRVNAAWGEGLATLDHKTYGVLSETAKGPRYEPKPRALTTTSYFHSRQFPTYVGVWNRLHPEAPIEQAVLNLVPQRVTHVLKYLETRTKKADLPEVTREVLPYDPSYCERLVAEVVDTALEIERRIEQGDAAVWRQHDNTCISYGETCAMMEACEAGDDQRAVILESYATQDESDQPMGFGDDE